MSPLEIIAILTLLFGRADRAPFPVFRWPDPVVRYLGVRDAFGVRR